MAANLRAARESPFPLNEVEQVRWLRLLETLAPPVRQSLERLILEAYATGTDASSPENPTG
jgi:hypothetical protein